MPRPVLLTTILLCLFAAALGLKAGLSRTVFGETEVISAAAADYVAFEAARGRAVRETDCVGRPGETVWIVVVCGAGERAIRYYIDRGGRMERSVAE